MPRSKQMKLGYIVEGPGRGFGDWRHPTAVPDAQTDFKYIVERARIAENGKFDMIFVADNVFLNPASTPPYFMSKLEPMTLLAGIAAATDRIGLGCTLSSTFTEPFNAARMFASLDHMSGGRAGWNLVTSTIPDSGRNFSMEIIPDHETRYAMAEEHVNICQMLWDSWEEGALIANKQTGEFVDPQRIHRIDFKGQYYQVQGPINISRMPQGYPVLFQAGTSETGRDFAARRADIAFVAEEPLEDGRALYADLKTRTAQYGRDPDKLLVIPSVVPFIGSTMAEAEEQYETKLNYVRPVDAYARMRRYFPVINPDEYALDEPFPADRIIVSELQGHQGLAARMLRMISEKKMTMRQALRALSGPLPIFLGTPERIADLFQEYFEKQAVDGFIITESVNGTLKTFVEHVVPILQKRGVFRSEYTGKTFRDHLGLDVPPNQFTEARKRSSAA